MRVEAPESNTGNTVERADLVAQLKKAGINDLETKRIFQEWKVKQIDVVAPIDLLMEQGWICEEAGLIDEAVMQFRNALDLGKRKENLVRGEEIIAEIKRLDPSYEFPVV